MNWLALSPAEVAAVWSALAALALWLYMHHRRPQNRRVSTLRFWASVQPIAQPRRRSSASPGRCWRKFCFCCCSFLRWRIPRLGATFEGRSVVIVFDTSIWSQVRPAAHLRGSTGSVKRLCASWILLPQGDRVLLLSAGADAPPILPFTIDRAAMHRAIADVRTSSSLADLSRALDTGQSCSGGSRERTRWSMLVPECWTISRRAAWTLFGKSWRAPTERASLNFLSG